MPYSHCSLKNDATNYLQKADILWLPGKVENVARSRKPMDGAGKRSIGRWGSVFHFRFHFHAWKKRPTPVLEGTEMSRRTCEAT